MTGFFCIACCPLDRRYSAPVLGPDGNPLPPPITMQPQPGGVGVTAFPAGAPGPDGTFFIPPPGMPMPGANGGWAPPPGMMVPGPDGTFVPYPGMPYPGMPGSPPPGMPMPMYGAPGTSAPPGAYPPAPGDPSMAFPPGAYPPPPPPNA